MISFDQARSIAAEYVTRVQEPKIGHRLALWDGETAEGEYHYFFGYNLRGLSPTSKDVEDLLLIGLGPLLVAKAGGRVSLGWSAASAQDHAERDTPDAVDRHPWTWEMPVSELSAVVRRSLAGLSARQYGEVTRTVLGWLTTNYRPLLREVRATAIERALVSGNSTGTGPADPSAITELVCALLPDADEMTPGDRLVDLTDPEVRVLFRVVDVATWSVRGM